MRRISEPLLECYLVDSLEAEARAQVEALLAESEADRARLEELRAESAAFLLRQPPGPLVQRFEVTQHRWWRNPLVLSLPVLAIVVLMVIVLVDALNKTEARAQQRLADANAAEARAQQRLADANLAEARAQQRLADANAAEAKAQQRLADANAAEEARAQQRLADANAAEARAQQRFADANAAEARAQQRIADANAAETRAQQRLADAKAAEARAQKKEPDGATGAVDFLRNLLLPKPKPEIAYIESDMALLMVGPEPKPGEDEVVRPRFSAEFNAITPEEQEPVRLEGPYRPSPQEKLVLRGEVHFAQGSTELPGVVPLLDQAVMRLSQLSKRGIVIVEGHADAEDTGTSKPIISVQRAMAVRRYLIAKGAPTMQMRLRGFGSDWPVIANPVTEAEHQLNRRVEVLVISQEVPIAPQSQTP
jgi:outer membrane protein OmpA-like peptidoglycan-associated protein